VDNFKYHIIPNNNVKYYLFITKKQNIEQCKEDYDILYFFPDEESYKAVSSIKTEVHQVTDFYVEINKNFDNSLLLEGYLYRKHDKYTYLITDVLVKDGKAVDCDYTLRHCIVNEIVISTNSCNCTLQNLNDHLTIGIHPIFDSENEALVQLFLDNFTYKNDIKSIEHVKGFNKSRVIQSKLLGDVPQDKMIEKGKYFDVYEVYNIDTGDSEGKLYIKGIKESKIMKAKFPTANTRLRMSCSFNEHFYKWQPKL
jgi:hypothetical protein